MNGLKHPHLLEIDYVINEKNAIFLVLPFIEGGDFKKLYNMMKKIHKNKQN